MRVHKRREESAQTIGPIYGWEKEAGEGLNLYTEGREYQHTLTHRPSLPFIILCCFCFVVVHFASSHCSLSLFSGRQYSPNEKKLGRPEKLGTTLRSDWLTDWALICMDRTCVHLGGREEGRERANRRRKFREKEERMNERQRGNIMGDIINNDDDGAW